MIKKLFIVLIMLMLATSAIAVEYNFLLGEYPEHPCPSLKLYVRYYLLKYYQVPLNKVFFENGVANLRIVFDVAPEGAVLTQIIDFLTGLNYVEQ